MLDAGINKTSPTTFVNIGLQNGVLLRTVLDPVNGQLTDTRTRFLGTRPIRLVRVLIQRNPGILALSSRSWLNYTYQNLMHFTPLIFENLDYAWSFSAELCPEGLIGISGSVLRWVCCFLWLRLRRSVLGIGWCLRCMPMLVTLSFTIIPNELCVLRISH